MQVCSYADKQVCKYASVGLSKYASMKLCEYMDVFYKKKSKSFSSHFEKS